METIVSFFLDIVEWCKDIFFIVVQFFLDLVAKLLDLVLLPLVELIPDISGYWGDYSVVLSYIKFANQFLDLSTAFSLLTFYITFVSGFIFCKLIIKMIPGVG